MHISFWLLAVSAFGLMYIGNTKYRNFWTWTFVRLRYLFSKKSIRRESANLVSWSFYATRVFYIDMLDIFFWLLSLSVPGIILHLFGGV